MSASGDLTDRPVLHISVRGLVEFLLRSGNLDVRHRANPEEAMQEGSRIHKKLQQEGGPRYAAEVPLSFLWQRETYSVEVAGRADGIIAPEEGEEPALYTIDEIKGTYRRLSRLKAPETVHLAQAKCYGFFYLAAHCGEEEASDSAAEKSIAADDRKAEETLREEDSAAEKPITAEIPEGEAAPREKRREPAQDMIRIQITYVNLDSERVRRFQEIWSFQELREWFLALMGEYGRWADHLIKWQRLSASSIEAMHFPYPFRGGQKTLMAQVYRTITEGKRLFVEAPTGVGKTLAVLYPAIKALAQGMGDRIFYLTARTITGSVARETVSLLNQGGLRIKVLTLTAKEKLCLNGEVSCNPTACPVAKGHFDRINEALFSLLTEEDNWDRDMITAYALRFQVCPYELSLDLSLFAGLIICDYNYAFDPTARLRRFFSASKKGAPLFLVDEAHNLVDRGREMFSASVCREELMAARRLVRGVPELSGLAKALQKTISLLNAWAKNGEGEEMYLEPSSLDAFLSAVDKSVSALASLLGREEEEEEEEEQQGQADKDRKEPAASPLLLPQIRECLLQVYFGLSFFLEIYGLLDEKYRVYAQYQENGYTLRLFCIDPSANLRAAMDSAFSVILFSATLLPITYYKKLLGGSREDYEVYAGSVFDPSRLGVFIAKDVTTKYSRRGPDTYRDIASYILRAASVKRGNYLVFFPSYSFLSSVREEMEKQMSFSDRAPRLLVQGRGMTEKEREEFLSDFREQTISTLIGLCVLGGLFSEGIDLKGKRLIGVIIAGTGLPMVCRENELVKEHFDGEGSGFDYAYRFPGMNRVLQAAGRVIRSAEDVGIAVLLDERFLSNSYRRLFPEEWVRCRSLCLEEVEDRLQEFWTGFADYPRDAAPAPSPDRGSNA